MLSLSATPSTPLCTTMKLLKSLSLCLAHEEYVDSRSVFPKVHVHSFRREYVKVLFRCFSGNTKSFTHVRSVICFEDLLSSLHIISLSTSNYWLIWSRKRSSFIRANPDLHMEPCYPLWWCPNENPVAFWRTNSMWARMSWHCVHMY